MTLLYLATEDALSEAVGDRIVAETTPALQITVRMRKNGIGYLKNNLRSLNALAANIPVLLIADLDRCACAPSLIQQWSGGTALSPALLFRVAVTETESWLMADREAFAEFVNAPVNKIPSSPEAVDDPKRQLIDLVRRYAPKPLRAEIVPPEGSRSPMGLGYNQVLGGFVRERWSPTRAARHADSLQRAIRRLQAIAA